MTNISIHNNTFEELKYVTRSYQSKFRHYGVQTKRTQTQAIVHKTWSKQLKINQQEGH